MFEAIFWWAHNPLSHGICFRPGKRMGRRGHKIHGLSAIYRSLGTQNCFWLERGRLMGRVTLLSYWRPIWQSNIAPPKPAPIQTTYPIMDGFLYIISYEIDLQPIGWCYFYRFLL